jgi:hypothetical protein
MKLISTQSVALVFGNEHSGVSEEIRPLADGNFIIPQVGIIRSLNISVLALFASTKRLDKKELPDITVATILIRLHLTNLRSHGIYTRLLITPF